MKLFFLLSFLIAITPLFASPSQQELWAQIEQAEADNRIDDAVRLLQEAYLLPGPFTEEIEISLQAYSEVLQRPELMPVIAEQKQDESPSEWGFTIDVGGYAGQYSQNNSIEEYQETYSGVNASFNLDWTLIRGNLFHTFSAGLSLGENIPLSATGAYADDSSLAATYTIGPTASYTLLWKYFLLGVGLDLTLAQGEDATFAGSTYTSYVLLRHGNLRWTAGASAYGGPFTRDQFSVRTGIQRKISNGISMGTTLAYVAVLDSTSEWDDATLYRSYGGPEASVKLGWTSKTWYAEAGFNYGVFTCFQKDQWIDQSLMTVLAWKKQYTRIKLALTLGWNITENVLVNASISDQIRTYANMPESHPEYSLSQSQTLGGDLGLSYSF